MYLIDAYLLHISYSLPAYLLLYLPVRFLLLQLAVVNDAWQLI